MKDPSQVRVTGPLGPYAKGFRAELGRQGYASSSAVNQLKLVGHLSRWTTTEGLSAPDLVPVQNRALRRSPACSTLPAQLVRAGTSAAAGGLRQLPRR
jgi:hypothetical protein